MTATKQKEEYEQQDPIAAFMYGLKAPETKRQWPGRLKVFLGYLALEDGTFEEKANQFIEKATTLVQQDKGLTTKDHLNENEGMLFVYQQPADHPIWMKDMKFPIDLIWMDSKGVVIHIERNVQPCIPGLVCPTYTPGSNNSLYVLGTAAGFSQRHNVEVGTHIDLHLT